MGNDINILSLEALKNMYEIAATNLKMAREKKDSPKDHKLIHLQPSDMVLVQNHTKGPFDPKYIGDYRVVAIKGNQVEVKPSIGGSTEMKHNQTCKIYTFSRQVYQTCSRLFNLWTKNHFKNKSKTDSRFTLAIGRSISHNQYRPIHPSSMYSQCGCEHLKALLEKADIIQMEPIYIWIQQL